MNNTYFLLWLGFIVVLCFALGLLVSLIYSADVAYNAGITNALPFADAIVVGSSSTSVP